MRGSPTTIDVRWKDRAEWQGVLLRWEAWSQDAVALEGV